ncbi:MAG: signal peptidase I [Clostridia bacterium]|nr:signal peptidase I [Clostridia bacterium]
MEADEIKEGSQEKETSWLVSILFELIGAVFCAIFVLMLFLAFFCRQVTVDGDSMNDTLQNEDRLLVACMGYTPKCGDIVIVTHGANLPEAIVKRVIATAGQTLEIDYNTGDVIVDGVLLKESYIKGVTRATIESWSIPRVIPEGYVFVMGDNRENSLDSRSSRVGLIPVENIIGRVFARWYPFEKLSGI